MMKSEQANLQRNVPWHQLRVPDLFVALETGPEGLSSAEASGRLLKCGPNAIRAALGSLST